jgi:hypothetical protein
VTDWATVASLATAGATLVLAGATFSAVRSSNRSARIAEQALLAGQRPLLMPSRLDDPPIKFQWGDGHDVKLRGGEAHAMVEDGNVYLAVSVRNSGRGVAVLQGWNPRLETTPGPYDFPPVEQFRRQMRDLYVGASDVGFWQGALRDDDELRAAMTALVLGPRPLLGRPAVQRPRRRAAHHDPVQLDARRAGRVAGLGHPPLQRGPRRPQIATAAR